MIIDQLPLLGGDVQGTDEFPIERGTTTYKTTQAALIKAATDAAAAAQAAADEAQDTADEANEKGLPPGGTAGQVLTKADSSDYSASWEDPSGGGDVTADMLGIVINGNSTPVGASVGQYVIVKNSTITGITDGLYTAAQAIPANTAIDATYLTEVSGGGLNAVVLHVSSKTYANGVVVRRFGSMRFLSVGGSYANPLCTLDSIDRPPITVTCFGRVYNGTTYVECVTYIETTGGVKVLNPYGGEISGINLDYLIGRGITYMVNG